jgi:hypothetical protein
MPRINRLPDSTWRVDALAFAWEHWDEILVKADPLAFVGSRAVL